MPVKVKTESNLKWSSFCLFVLMLEILITRDDGWDLIHHFKKPVLY